MPTIIRNTWKGEKWTCESRGDPRCPPEVQSPSLLINLLEKVKKQKTRIHTHNATHENKNTRWQMKRNEMTEWKDLECGPCGVTVSVPSPNHNRIQQISAQYKNKHLNENEIARHLPVENLRDAKFPNHLLPISDPPTRSGKMAGSRSKVAVEIGRSETNLSCLGRQM